MIELASEEEHHPGYGIKLTSCASDRDGECNHPGCPQNKDNEPFATGRSCPLWVVDDEY